MSRDRRWWWAAVVAAALVSSLSGGAQSARRVSLAEPGISPDGREIAFVSGGDIWNVPASGGDARLLVSDPSTESRPLFSPDGTSLAFVSTRTGGGDIYVLTLASGDVEPQALRAQTVSVRVDWRDRSGTPQIWIMSAEGTNARRCFRTLTGPTKCSTRRSAGAGSGPTTVTASKWVPPTSGCARLTMR